jgi:hypothetical protein
MKDRELLIRSVVNLMLAIGVRYCRLKLFGHTRAGEVCFSRRGS